MLAVLPPLKTHRFTVDEFYQMAELGWFADPNIELIEGQIIDMPAQSNLHALAITLLYEALFRVLGALCWVRVQMPIDLHPDSVPNPDVAVISGLPRMHRTRKNPTTALLVGEVSDSTLASDQTNKNWLYAKAGIAEYWIINLVDNVLDVYRDPQTDPTNDLGFSYASVTTLRAGDFVSPLAAPQARIAVADLLP